MSLKDAYPLIDKILVTLNFPHNCHTENCHLRAKELLKKNMLKMGGSLCNNKEEVSYIPIVAMIREYLSDNLKDFKKYIAEVSDRDVNLSPALLKKIKLTISPAELEEGKRIAKTIIKVDKIRELTLARANITALIKDLDEELAK